MSEREEGGTVVELLLREPEIVAWLDDYRADDAADEDREETTDDDETRGRCVNVPAQPRHLTLFG